MHVHHSPPRSWAGLGRVRGRAGLAGSRAGQVPALGLPDAGSRLGRSKALYGSGRGARLATPIGWAGTPSLAPWAPNHGNQSCQELVD